MGLFSQAEFYTTVNHLKDLPLHGGKEVAFVGRSNAGKSSAINTLANHTRLAYTSKTRWNCGSIPVAVAFGKGFPGSLHDRNTTEK